MMSKVGPGPQDDPKKYDEVGSITFGYDYLYQNLLRFLLKEYPEIKNIWENKINRALEFGETLEED